MNDSLAGTKEQSNETNRSSLRGRSCAAPPPPGSVITNPAIQATILIDTHTSNDTPTAGFATVYLRQGTITTQSSFQVVPAAQSHWLHGCDTTVTTARFLWSPQANLQL